ncbi:hypothetical protein BDM02DRAFT_62161 [Thelephora ganbajun]|uniref:Uncharacterized protein n=1 Tax=Thelephora ganbajun TaxID=370292 RepID=A0ACB6ZXT1_THEGA|nr:hypothetical protein BDM02DRAFT_62161 [Thelephora ganbajun]
MRVIRPLLAPNISPPHRSRVKYTSPPSTWILAALLCLVALKRAIAEVAPSTSSTQLEFPIPSPSRFVAVVPQTASTHLLAWYRLSGALFLEPHSPRLRILFWIKARPTTPRGPTVDLGSQRHVLMDFQGLDKGDIHRYLPRQTCLRFDLDEPAFYPPIPEFLDE